MFYWPSFDMKQRVTWSLMEYSQLLRSLNFIGFSWWNILPTTICSILFHVSLVNNFFLQQVLFVVELFHFGKELGGFYSSSFFVIMVDYSPCSRLQSP